MANTDTNKELVRFLVSAPGKVILHGEHSVVYGKTALAASLSLRTRLAFQETNDTNGQIRLLLPDIDIAYTLDMEELNKLLKTSSLLLKDSSTYSDYSWHQPDLIDKDRFQLWVKDCLIKDPTSKWDAGQQNALIAFHLLLIGMLSGIDMTVKSFELVITSELTIGAGLGSSASYSICLAAGLYQYAKSCIVQANRRGLNIAREGFHSCIITSSDLTSLDPKERDLVERWGSLSDGIMHGTASGVDSATITAGGVVEFRRASEGQAQPHFARVPHAALLKIVLVNTGVSRNTKRLVSEVKALKERLPRVVDALLEAMDQVSLAARALLAKTNCMDQLGELVDLNHHLLQALGVSHPALDDICSIAKKHGLSSKLTGAGGGGYALILLPPTLSSEKVIALLDELSAKGYQSVVTSLGGLGVEVGSHAEL